MYFLVFSQDWDKVTKFPPKPSVHSVGKKNATSWILVAPENRPGPRSFDHMPPSIFQGRTLTLRGMHATIFPKAPWFSTYIGRKRPRLGRCQVAATKSVVLTPLLHKFRNIHKYEWSLLFVAKKASTKFHAVQFAKSILATCSIHDIPNRSTPTL